MKSRGFALTELAIMLIVVAVLLTIGITHLNEAKVNTRKASIESLVGNMKITLEELIKSAPKYRDPITGEWKNGDKLVKGYPTSKDLLNATLGATTVGEGKPWNTKTDGDGVTIYRTDAILPGKNCSVTYNLKDNNGYITYDVTGC